MNPRYGTSLLAALLAVGSPAAIGHNNDRTKTVRVDCARGQTIARALTRGDEDKDLLVLIRGTCNESVLIDRADVTLRGETGTGATIRGPDPSVDTVIVAAARVAIEDLRITGGQNGIRAGGPGLSVLRTTVESTGRTGIVVGGSSSCVIDQSTIELNGRDGIATEGSSVTVINSTVSRNSRIGIFVGTGAAARIGVDNTNVAGASTVSENGATGVSIFLGGAAVIANTQITANGADPTTTAGRVGVAVQQATVDLIGNNTIANHPGQGIFMRSSTANLGNPTLGFSTVNTISGNALGGLLANLGSALQIRDAVISTNGLFGMNLGLRSHATLASSRIENNSGNGITLSLGAGLAAGAPSIVAGNTGLQLACFDGESSVVNTPGLGLPPIVPPPPGTFTFPPNCTGFENLQ